MLVLAYFYARDRIRQVRKMLEDRGLVAEFVAPRLWEDKVRTLDRRMEREFIKARDYEGLELFILEHICV